MSRAVVYMLSCVFLFSLINLAVKYLSHISFLQIIFFRGVISLILSATALKIQKKSLIGNNKKILFLRGLTGTIGLTLFFLTIQHLSLSSAVVLHYLAPLFTILLAGPILNEPAHPLQWLFCLFAFCGVLLIKGFDPTSSTPLIVISVIASVFSSIAYNLVRKLRTTDNANVTVMYFSFVTIPCILPFLFKLWIQPRLVEWFLLIGIGTVTHVAQILLTKAFHLEKAEKLIFYSYFGVIFAVFYGWFFFDEKLNTMTSLGFAIIVFSVFLSSLFRIKRIKKLAQA